MAKTPEQKLRTAELICDAGKEYGLGPERFVFDVLTFTLATGEAEFADAGVRTLEGISLVKERFPESGTVLGLSNISFGLRPPARRAVNSVFLHHAVRRGLDCAIVNAREMVPYGDLGAEERRLAEDLVLNRGQDALAGLIEHFESAAGGAGSSGGRGSAGPEVDPSWDAGRRAAFRVVNRLKDGIAADVVEAIAEKISKKGSLRRAGEGPPVLDEPPSVTHGGAIRTLNEDLLPAMKVVGDKFGSGELILPFVLKSAECMKAAVAELEKYLLKEAGSRAKGVVVLGTVYGDVHDIGKNLVKTILENNGYEVHDLGKQVPVQAFVDKIAEVGPDAVGLSALLVSTSKQMQLFVEHARSSGMDVPVLCGGAAINGQYISRIARDGGIYGPGVFYCNTMFEGLKTMDALVDPARRGALLSEWRGRLEKWKDPLERAAAPAAPRASRGPAVRPASPPPPPSLGEPIRLGAAEIPMGEVWPLLDRRSLFKLSWGLRGKAGRASEAEHAVLLDEWKGRVAAEGLFEPAAVYGYFSCRGEGNSLEVEDPAGGSVTFEFPRSSGPRALCLSDYFGGEDVVAFQAVTVGGRVTEVIDGWNAQDRYADAYYLHGLAVEAAEALAGWGQREDSVRTRAGRRAAGGRRPPRSLPAVQLGVPELPRRGAAPAGVAPAGAGKVGHDSHRVGADRPGTVHGGHGGAPPRRRVLWGLAVAGPQFSQEGRARREVVGGREQDVAGDAVHLAREARRVARVPGPVHPQQLRRAPVLLGRDQHYGDDAELGPEARAQALHRAGGPDDLRHEAVGPRRHLSGDLCKVWNARDGQQQAEAVLAPPLPQAGHRRARREPRVRGPSR